MHATYTLYTRHLACACTRAHMAIVYDYVCARMTKSSFKEQNSMTLCCSSQNFLDVFEETTNVLSLQKPA